MVLTVLSISLYYFSLSFVCQTECFDFSDIVIELHTEISLFCLTVAEFSSSRAVQTPVISPLAPAVKSL